MSGMVVSVMDVVKVIAMLDGIVAAAWLMRVLVVAVGNVRERVLVVVAFMRRVCVTIMDEVGMSVMLDANVPATWTVLVRVFRVDSVRVGRHRSPVMSVTSLSLAGFCPGGGLRRLKFPLLFEADASHDPPPAP